MIRCSYRMVVVGGEGVTQIEERVAGASETRHSVSISIDEEPEKNERPGHGPSVNLEYSERWTVGCADRSVFHFCIQKEMNAR